MEIEDKLNKMKLEIAAEFGIENYDKIDKGELSSRMNGKIGGEMVKRLVELGKKQLLLEEQRELVPIKVVHKQERAKVLALPLPEYLPEYAENSYFPKEYLQ